MVRLAYVRLRPGPVDVAIALLLAAGAQVQVWLDGASWPTEAKVTAVLLPTLPLAWRSVAPVPTVALTTGGFGLAVLLGLPADDALVPRLAPMLAVYSVGVHAGARGLLAAGLIAPIPEVAVAALGDGSLTDVAATIGFTVGALAVGRAVRVMGFETDVLEARAASLERERDEQARRAVAAERARIARELHDVIAHSISVMGVQAGAVRRLLAADQQRERETLLAVERTGRDAVAEMRRLLGFLRSPDGDDESLVPPPTLGRVDDLVADIRRAGLDVDLQVDGDLGDLSPGRALAAFRILQEGLTNALKHAPSASVRATLLRTPAELRIEVVDDGCAASSAGSADGYGLVGMRERVALYGGTLDAGPGDGGGFRVVARLPMEGP
jgi:signal transduction histidine kinase